MFASTHGAHKALSHVAEQHWLQPSLVAPAAIDDDEQQNSLQLQQQQPIDAQQQQPNRVSGSVVYGGELRPPDCDAAAQNKEHSTTQLPCTDHTQCTAHIETGVGLEASRLDGWVQQQQSPAATVAAVTEKGGVRLHHPDLNSWAKILPQVCKWLDACVFMCECCVKRCVLVYVSGKVPHRCSSKM